MFTLTLILIWLIEPKPAEIDLSVDAGFTKYSIFLNDQLIPAGIIRTEPLRVEVEAVVDVAWLNGNKIEWRSFVVTFYPGYRIQWKIELPRVSPVWLEC